MLPKSLLLAATSFTIAAAQPVQKPAPAPVERTAPATTVNCILASNVFAQRETDPKQKDLAQQTMSFYLGRLSPKITTAELTTALKLAADGLKGVNAASLMNNCLAEFRAKSELLQNAGKQLQQQK